MAQPTIELEGMNIVLLGTFNPMIFQPAWFSAEGLLRREEAEAVEGVIIHREIASFETSWVNLQVRPERFMASTANSSFYEPLRDLVFGTFQVLHHTPIQKLGLNRNFHFKMESEAAWHGVGHRLAPKEPWAHILDKPGMLRLEMRGERPDDLLGYIRIRVEPSQRVRPGVFINVNDHYELSDTDTSRGCGEIMDILRRVWKDSVERATRMAHELLEIA